MGAFCSAILPEIAPEAMTAAQTIISNWVLEPEYLEMMREGAGKAPWSEMDANGIYALVAKELGQNLTNDFALPMRTKWFALGIEWTITCPRKLKHVADALAAILQIAQVDLADLDLLIIPSNVEIFSKILANLGNFRRCQTMGDWHGDGACPARRLPTRAIPIAKK